MISRSGRGLEWGVVLMLLAALGCARTYNANTGVGRSDREVAVITPGPGVKIHALDGRVVNVKPTADSDWYKYTRMRLRPGEYSLTLIPQGIETVKTFTRLTVRVAAGERYRVRSEFIPGAGNRPGHYTFWVDNERTGAVVSDIVESRNPFQQQNSVR
jgi:hypothetical protein